MMRLVAWIAVAVLAAESALAQTDTTFTYQGALSDAGSPANGPYDLRFSVWDAFAGGTQQGSSITVNDVRVTNGHFSVQLDYGASPFSGDPRWLEIRVEGITLSPRQPITQSPYAVTTRGIFVNNTETFVGIGREVPVTTAEAFGVTRDTSGFGGMYVQTTGSSGDPFYGYSAGGGADAFHAYDGATGLWYYSNSGGVRFEITDNGRIGIGDPASFFGQLTVADRGALIGIDASSSSSSFPTLQARNSGVGPVLWAHGTMDVALAGGGLIVLGEESGPNIGLDRNEIMARDNGAASTLFINAEGGEVAMGEHRIHPALAYGSVYVDGTLISGSSNITATRRTGEGKYEVEIAGGFSGTDIAIASNAGFPLPNVSVYARVQSGELHIWSHQGGDDKDNLVSFVVYRP